MTAADSNVRYLLSDAIKQLTLSWTDAQALWMLRVKDALHVIITIEDKSTPRLNCIVDACDNREHCFGCLSAVFMEEKKKRFLGKEVVYNHEGTLQAHSLQNCSSSLPSRYR